MHTIDGIKAKTIIERWENVLRVLRGLTPHQRRKHWDMSYFGEQNECGTVACAAGHCGLDPWFRKRGLRLNFEKSSETGHMSIEPEDFFGETGSYKIFYNTRHRPVGQVIKEVKDHIRWLKNPARVEDEGWED